MSNPIQRDPALDEYIAEGVEILERVSKCLQEIERSGGVGQPEQVSGLYRDVHTLKGSSQLFGYKSIALVAHAMEASLDPLRKSHAKISQRLIEACLRNIDLLDRLLAEVRGDRARAPSIDEITVIVSALVDAATAHFSGEAQLISDDPGMSEKVQRIEGPIATPRSVQPDVAVGVSVGIAATAAWPATQAHDATTPTSPTRVEGLDSTTGSQPATQFEGTIRVHVALLDRILNLVGELVLVRNQLLQQRSKIDNPEFISTSKSLDVVTSDLQTEVMKTRMQPIGTVVEKFQRLVRDTSRDLQKRIDLTLEGADTELDKSLLEAVKDPLTHIVRNSCDHGIETPDERKKANKPETGHLLIRSFHEGGQIVIEVSDDGRGLNRTKILAKAVESGLVSAEDSKSLTDGEICSLIFRPGFSTASEVTAVSGRGVGMDVVKTNIERIGGSVEVSSVVGKGTSIRLQIPLTLAIVPALLVNAGTEKFAIPQVKLVELVRVESESSQTKIEYLQGKPIYRLRGDLIPLLDLRDVVQVERAKDYADGANIVILNADGDCFGLIVSQILDTADIVVKPLSTFLRQLSIFSGSTILGDGSIALILEPSGVAEYGKVLGKRAAGEETEVFSRSEKAARSTDIQEFLVISAGTDAEHAIPLCLVQRLEEFNARDIEVSGRQKVVRYRDALLPLIDLRHELQYEGDVKVAAQQSGESRIPVVVIQRSGRQFGIVVRDILDIVTIETTIDDTIRDRVGILGNLIHEKRVIVVIDALGIIERFAPTAGSGQSRTQASSVEELKSLNQNLKSKKIRVLYAEDVAFFRRHVSKVLNEAGIDVTTVEDGAKAIEELESAGRDRYNLVLSDIEMPKMDGLELARQIRKREAFRHLPMIALTTRFRDKDVDEGTRAGFNIYLEKLNPEKLLDSIQSLFESKSEPKIEVEAV